MAASKIGGAAFAVALFVALAGCSSALAQELWNHELSGTLGTERITLLLGLRDDGSVAQASYFHLHDLRDIPLKARREGQVLVLEEADGGAFKLDLNRRASTAQGDDIFEGLNGDWVRGALSRRVRLDDRWINYAPWGRLYADLGASDAEVEATVRGFLNGALAGDPAETAKYVSFPLRVNGPGKRVRHIRDAAALRAQWKTIFTPKLVKALRDAVPHQMFVHDASVTIGGGDVWFKAKGAVAINLDL